MKPICVKCKKFYRPKENGYCFTEGMPTSSGEWKPYKAWMGDLWECPECGHQLLEQSLGTRLVTYADDLVILCRRGSAETALHHLREIMGKLKLAVIAHR
jgi:hypothetical protein